MLTWNATGKKNRAHNCLTVSNLKLDSVCSNVFGKSTVGKCLMAGVGLAVTLFALIISFFPSSELSAQANIVYVITLIVCWVVSVAIPFVIYGLRHHWDGTKKPAGTSTPKTTHRGGTHAPHPAG